MPNPFDIFDWSSDFYCKCKGILDWWTEVLLGGVVYILCVTGALIGLQTLREEIADLQGRLRQMETSRSIFTAAGSEGDLLQKVTNLEAEVQQKRVEVATLRDQVSQEAVIVKNLLKNFNGIYYV